MITLRIVTPEGAIDHNSKKEIKSVTFPTESGVITVMEDHKPLVTILAPGEIVITYKDNSEELLAVSTGMTEVKKNSKLHMLADTAERAMDIDLKRAEAAKQKAEELLAKQDQLADFDFARIQAMIEKEMARIRVGKKYKGLKITSRK